MGKYIPVKIIKINHNYKQENFRYYNIDGTRVPLTNSELLAWQAASVEPTLWVEWTPQMRAFAASLLKGWSGYAWKDGEYIDDIQEYLDDAVEGWQPIDTAPIDGTAILGFRDGVMTTIEWRTSGDVPIYVPGYWSLLVAGDHAEDDEWTPTHWQPLPASPA